MPQTKDYLTGIIPIIPKDYSTGNSAYVARIEAVVIGLSGELGSAKLSKAKSIIQDLRALSGMVGSAGSKAGKVQAMIGSVIARAQRQIEELEYEAVRVDVTGSEKKFEAGVYVLMSYEAKRFYNEINPEVHYYLAPVSHEGEILHHAARKIDGRTIRKHMSLLKFHSFDTASKKKILYESFGAEAAEGEGTPKNKAHLETKKKDLHALHDALDHMEAYKAYMLTHKYYKAHAAEIIAKNHELIVQMHAQVDEVLRKYDGLINDIDNGMAMAQLKVAKLKMKQMLRDDIISHVLLEKPLSPAISGGIMVASVAPHATGMGFDAVPQFFRPLTEYG